jgi:hypothetical protein
LALEAWRLALQPQVEFFFSTTGCIFFFRTILIWLKVYKAACKKRQFLTESQIANSKSPLSYGKRISSVGHSNAISNTMHLAMYHANLSFLIPYISKRELLLYSA